MSECGFVVRLVRGWSVDSLVHVEAEVCVQVQADPIYCIPCDECGENCYEESWCIEQLDLVTTPQCTILLDHHHSALYC